MRLGIRWTVGDVAPRGWEALRLSVHCAVRLFGPESAYSICVNGVPLDLAQERTGELPRGVAWRAQTPEDVPAFLRPHLGPEMAEGTGWKLLPPRLFPGRHELSLDNDCLLWEQPAALRAWLAREDATLMAEDEERSLGQFQDAAVPGALNSGIRGLPPGFDFEAQIQDALTDEQQRRGEPVILHSELDEQGLQAAALYRASPLLLVSKEEVSICSPFWPRNPELGSCGAHFVGLNVRTYSWNYYDRPGHEVREEHWDRHRPELYARAGLASPPVLL